MQFATRQRWFRFSALATGTSLARFLVRNQWSSLWLAVQEKSLWIRFHIIKGMTESPDGSEQPMRTVMGDELHVYPSWVHLLQLSKIKGAASVQGVRSGV